MYKTNFLKIICITIVISMFSFSFCFASEGEVSDNLENNKDKEELLLVINNCVDEIKSELKKIDKTLADLDDTDEYEKYPAIRLNIDTPFFGLNSMVDQKLKIKSDVSTVDVANGYSIKDVVNDMSIKLPDFKVGNIVVSTRNVKFDENISIEDAQTSILKLVQYISQTKNTEELLNKRINNIFEDYIPKEKSEKIENLNKKIENIESNVISKDDDILTIKILSADENSKVLVDKYYDINNKIYNLENSLENVLLNNEELEVIEKSSIDLEMEVLNYLNEVSKEVGNITKDLNVDTLLVNSKTILDAKKQTMDSYLENSVLKEEIPVDENQENKTPEIKETKQYSVTSRYIVDYEQTLINSLNEKFSYYIQAPSQEENKKEVSSDEKKELLKDVLKLYNDFVSKENKFYLDNLNYMLRDTTYKLAKLPEYTDATTVKDIEYIYISLPDQIDELLDKYNTKSTLQTDTLTSELYNRLLKLVNSNIQVTKEYDKFNLS